MNNNRNFPYSRRQFLQQVGAVGASAVAMNPLMGLFQKAFAGADNVSGYKALVCVMFNGGNDGFNWFVPTTNNSQGLSDYATYSTTRGAVALSQSSLLSLGSGGVGSDGNTYGINPNCPELQALFKSGKMALLSNLGTLVQPVTQAQARSNSSLIPLNLFSHNDQQHQWMTSLPNSLVQNVGVAGKIGDLLASESANPKVPLNISLSGNNLFQSGLQTSCYAMGTSGPQTLNLSSGSHGSIASTFQNLLTLGNSDSNVMVQTYSQLHQQSAGYLPYFSSALSGAGSFTTSFPVPPGDGSNGGADQLFLAVAKLIKAQSTLQGTRQIFYIQLNGFDSHQNQITAQGANLKVVSSLMNAFYQAMVEIGQQNNVVQFTASDFGRSLGSNSGGTDHGWGSHHIVVGGPVVGGKIYGNAPSLVIGGTNDLWDGRIIPTTSTDQYYATLLNWFGISAADVAATLPNLANFSANLNFNFKSSSNIGFLG